MSKKNSECHIVIYQSVHSAMPITGMNGKSNLIRMILKTATAPDCVLGKQMKLCSAYRHSSTLNTPAGTLASRQLI